MTEQEYTEMVDALPVESTTDIFPAYRAYAASCIERGEEFMAFSDWRANQEVSLAA